MNAVTEIDLGPLTWVKGEVGLALEHAADALSQFQKEGDPARLQLCRTALRQVYGALSIVGLDGEAQVCEALASLVENLEKAGGVKEAPLAVAQNAITSIRHYLDGLLMGEPHQTLRLLPAYREIQEIQGKKVSPVDLFFPDLSFRPAKRALATLSPTERLSFIHAERGRFQKGLLAWLRQAPGSPEGRTGLAQMQDALKRIESVQTLPSARAFWLGALGLVTAQGTGARIGDIRPLCARIDLQIRRLLDGQPGVAERLLRDILYCIAQAPAEADPLVAEIHRNYELARLIPPAEQARASGTAHDTALYRLKEHLGVAEEHWNRFCSGSASSLKAFVEQAGGIFQIASGLGNDDLKLLTQALYTAGAWLAKQTGQQPEAIAMEIATALILVQSAQENFSHLGQDFPQQVRLMVARLGICVKGGTPPSDSVPLLDEISRRAHERLLMVQVVREVQANLSQVEQALDAFFRDPGTPLDATSLENPLRQVSGVLAILEHDDAAQYLRACAEQIQAFAETPSTATSADFEKVAYQLSTLGFFIETLQHGEVGFTDYLKRLVHQEDAEKAAEAEEEEAQIATVESQLARLKAEMQRLLEALKSQPDDPGLREELRVSLQRLQKDAELVGDQTLATQAKQALASLREAPRPQQQQAPAQARQASASIQQTPPPAPAGGVQQVVDLLAPMIEIAPTVPTPSAETVQLAQSSAEELDAELLEIFLEEAQEVLQTVRENLDILHGHPHDIETLTTIRRSSHTMKGSGRMVGLKDLGEVAWAVEQTLNLWLGQKWEATPELIRMIEGMYQVFSEWLTHLNNKDGQTPQYADLVALAERLRAEDGGGSHAAPVPSPASSITQSQAADPFSLAAIDLKEGPSSRPFDSLVTPDPGVTAKPGSEEIVDWDALFETETGLPAAETPPEAEAPVFESESAEVTEPESETDLWGKSSPEAKAVSGPEEIPAPEAFVSETAVPEAIAEAEPETIPALERENAEVVEAAPEATVDATWEETPEPEAPSEPETLEEAPAVEEAVDAGESASAEADAASGTSPLEGIPPQLFEIFQGESRKYIETLQEFMGDLALIPAMPTEFNAGRAAHTLAGIAGTLGFMPLNALSHALELTLWRRDDSESPEDPESLKVLQDTVDMLQGMLEGLDRGILPQAHPELIDALKPLYPPRPDPVEEIPAVSPATVRQFEEHVRVPEVASPASSLIPESLADLPPDEPDPDLLPIFLEESVDLLESLYSGLHSWQEGNADAAQSLARTLHTIKGSARMAGLRRLGQFTHEIESWSEELRQRADVRESDLDQIVAASDLLAQVIEVLKDGGVEQANRILTPQAGVAQAVEILVPESPEPPALLTEWEEVVPEEVPALETASAIQLPEILATMPPDTLEADLLPIFLEEAVDLVDTLYAQIRLWRENRASESAPQGLARALHTIKGSARMAGAQRLGQFTHEVESWVGELQRQDGVQDADLDRIEAATDILAQVVEAYRSDDPEAVNQMLTPGRPAAQVVAPQGIPPAVQPAQEVFPAEIPPASEPAAQTLHPEEIAPPDLSQQEAAIQNDRRRRARQAEAEAGRAMLRIRADLVDQLVNEAGELSIIRARIEGEMRELKDSLLTLTDNVIRLRRQLREIEIQAETQIQAGADESKEDFDPLELDRFTRFQELTRMMAESVNDVSTVQQNLLKNLDGASLAIATQARLNRSLQQSLMSVRMVPFESQNERLYRLVRQVSQELGKRATLQILGGQVEMDRSVLEKIFSPLEHMVRNAIAHGLEPVEQRRAAGKPDIGEITLSLTQEGNEVILALADDGGGLDLQRIRAKAEKSGLLPPGLEIEERKLVDFIFHSGFSTATTVTQVAGRGVGMDVVKTEVAALGGRIEVLTQSGKGTTFQLYLPLTLAVTQAVLVRAGGRKYALPSAMIEQAMEIRGKTLQEIRDRGEAIWQDHHYPFHYLLRLLGDETTLIEQRPLYWVLLLRSGAQRVAILIDEMYGNQEIVVKNVGPQMARVVGISGATVLGDGQVVLILNPVALASRMPSVVVRAEDVPVAEEPGTMTPHQPIVMVVDDSLTVRKITQKLLVREGYQVELAKDGMDALEHLVDLVPDVILSDIEMPRMDGFDLVRHIRADARLAEVPVIMITSRTAEKHRTRAVEVGANNYLGKPYDDTELLGLLAEYTGRKSA
ncbi:MAG: Hpt domain-containing protein [Zoogloeaceae bacterium]|jgi:chemosensory pili system protein ChpA (sensor histidine kinase/response regulator)|nr:Hpt domain-containing protein [Zoogloeaceae bacterium]